MTGSNMSLMARPKYGDVTMDGTRRSIAYISTLVAVMLAVRVLLGCQQAGPTDTVEAAGAEQERGVAASSRTALARSGRSLSRMASHGVYQWADANSKPGATVSIYRGAYDPSVDYDAARPAKTQSIELGVARNSLPAIPGPHTHVVRGFIDVPESGTYIVNPGEGDSTYCAVILDGQEVYRREHGGSPVRKEYALAKGKRYEFAITYFKGGSTAFWMRRMDRVGAEGPVTPTKRQG